MVSIERFLNEHIDLIALNKSNAINTKPILERHHLTHNRFTELPLKKELHTELGSLDLANRYFSYERGVHRANVDSQSLNYTLTRFEDVMIGGGVLPGENFQYVVGAVDRIPGLMDVLTKETIGLLSLVRLYVSRLAGKGLWYANWNKNWDMQISEEDLKAERIKLEKEIEESASRTTH